MPEEDTSSEGISSILDRVEEQLNDIHPTVDDDAASNKEGQAGSSTDDLDSLDVASHTPETKTSDDPLDAIESSEDSGASSPEVESSGEPSGNVLDEFDEADRVKLQKYLDERVTEELKLTESAGGAFKRIKSENRELEQKIRELETRTAEPEALKAATDRVAELEAQVKATEEANSVLRLEDTQAYRDAVTKPQQEILASSDAIADRYGVDRDQLANILGNPNRRELSDNLNSVLGDDVLDADKFELYDLSRKAEATFAKKNELSSNAEQALQEAEELADKAREKDALAQRTNREEHGQAAVDRIKSKAGVILDIVGEETVDSFKKEHSDYPIEALSDADQAFARFAYKAVIPLAKQVKKLESELQDANDDILKLRGSTRGDSGGGGGTLTSSEGSSSEGKTSTTGISSAVDRIGSALGGMG